MKTSLFCAVTAVFLSGGLAFVEAQTNTTSAAPKLSAAEQEKRTEEKHAKPILDALKLNDAAKEAKVREIVGAQIKILNDWHTQNDAQIKSLWKEFAAARSKQDDTGADAALTKISAVYATFKPRHEKFDADLSSVLTPEQIEAVKDAITIDKVKITFNVYGQIFHGLTEEQKAFILKNLKAAREEAIDAGTMPEKSDFFKKYKIKIEAYLTSQGYDVKQSYREFVAKQKADDAAKKAVTKSAAEDKK